MKKVKVLDEFTDMVLVWYVDDDWELELLAQELGCDVKDLRIIEIEEVFEEEL